MLKTLGFAVPVFYGVYYAIAAVLSAAFGAAFDGTEPFDSADFTPVVVDGHYRSLAPGGGLLEPLPTTTRALQRKDN